MNAVNVSESECAECERIGANGCINMESVGASKYLIFFGFFELISPNLI